MDETIKLRSDRRSTLQISASDKAEFQKLKGDLSDWQLFRKMLAVYLVHVSEEEAAA